MTSLWISIRTQLIATAAIVLLGVAPESVNATEGGGSVKFVSQVVPSSMDAGGEYTIMVQFKGSKSSWSAASGNILVSQNPARNNTWGIDKVKLDGDHTSIAGDVATVRFKVKAPVEAGTYDFQWQLYQEGSGFFGERTPNVRIKVGGAGRGNDAEFVMQEFPGLVGDAAPYAVMRPSQSFSVKMMFKNVGTTTWKAGGYKLTSQQPANNLNWFIDHVDLAAKDEIKPGEFKTFTFTAVAPAQPGIYDFQWRLFQDGVTWFGSPTALVKITVR